MNDSNTQIFLLILYPTFPKWTLLYIEATVYRTHFALSNFWSPIYAILFVMNTPALCPSQFNRTQTSDLSLSFLITMLLIWHIYIIMHHMYFG